MALKIKTKRIDGSSVLILKDKRERFVAEPPKSDGGEQKGASDLYTPLDAKNEKRRVRFECSNDFDQRRTWPMELETW